jgi:hypothetical protein
MSEESIFPAPRAQTNGQEENKNGSSTEGARPNHPWIVGGPGFAGNGQFCILDWWIQDGEEGGMFNSIRGPCAAVFHG